MDKAILIQQQIKDNAQDLQSHLSDLNNWEQEMKRKESEISGIPIEKDIPPVRSNLKKTKAKISELKRDEKRISSSDYAAWDKFDVDKACEKVDTEDLAPVSLDAKMSEQDKTQKLREEAQYEKEHGNQFVKLQKWDDAIACYTRAINLYRDDAIYYANRGLCYLKKENLHLAEADCTRALELDPGYVKAWQRRSCAREGLGSLRRAAADLQALLKLEPRNLAAKKQLAALTQRMGTKGPNVKTSPATTPTSTESDQSFSPPEPAPITPVDNPSKTFLPKPEGSPEKVKSAQLDLKQEEAKTKQKNEENVDTCNNVGSKSVAAIEKPPHLRSKAPLMRVEIDEIPRGESAPKLDANSDIDNVMKKYLNQNKDRSSDPEPKKDLIKQDVKIKDDAVKLNFKTAEGGADFVETSSRKLTKPAENVKQVTEQNIAKVVEILEDVKEKQDEVNNVKNKISSNVAKTEGSGKKHGRRKKKEAAVVSSVDMDKLAITDDPPDVTSVPKTSVQFNSNWKCLKGRHNERSAYLKAIPPNKLPEIFQNFLDSDTLSEILHTLDTGEDFNKTDEATGKSLVPSLPYLVNLSKVKRFTAQVMFLSDADKQVVTKILQRCKENDATPQKDLNDVRGKYEL